MPRRFYLLPLLAIIAGPALAGPREETMSGISRCATLPDDRGFLDCIYGAAQPMRTRLGLPPAPASQQRLVPPAYAAPVAAPRTTMRTRKDSTSTLGNILGSNPTPGWLESFSFDGRGLFTVTLSNGEIWRQDPSDPARAHWNGRASDYGIKLAKDTGGRSGQLFVRGDAPLYRVVKLR
jgi:hypothetical protein